MNFGRLVSVPMTLPNGAIRIIQHNKKSKHAQWVTQRDGKLVMISGEWISQNGQYFFFPKKDSDREWILKDHKAQRMRLKTPLNEEQYEKNRTIHHNRRKEKVLDLELNYGNMFLYKGKKRKMHYTRLDEPVGHLHADGETIRGYIHKGKFVALKKGVVI